MMGSKGSEARNSATQTRNTYGVDSQNFEGVVYLIIYLCGGDLVCQQTECNPTQDYEKAPAEVVSRS